MGTIFLVVEVLSQTSPYNSLESSASSSGVLKEEDGPEMDGGKVGLELIKVFNTYTWFKL